MRARLVMALFVLSLASLSGCSCSAPAGMTRRDGGAAGGDAAPEIDASRDVDGARPPVPDADGPVDLGFDARIDRTAFCMGMGPPVLVGDAVTGTTTCAGAIATRVFNNAVCSCANTNVVGYLRTRSFDSGMGTGETESGAPVGVNRDYLTGGYADIGGSFVVGGASGVTFGGYLKVGGDARFAGSITALGYINVARDLWVLGNVTIPALTVGRDLHQPSGGLVLAFPDVGGDTIRTPFTVEAPCACDPDELIDVAAIVADGRANNDNDDIGLSTSRLTNVVGIGVDIALPCGRFYVDDIGGLGSITLRVPGRTALFVGGDVNALGVFDVDLGPEGELDLFIAGNLVSIGAGSYGDRARPARTRIYVGGGSDVTVVGASGFVGNVYAPYARVTALGATTVYGSLFGRQIDMPGYLDVRYDRAILDVAEDCPPPPGGCEMCGGDVCPDRRACIGGACAACTADSDCCAPLVCYPDGTCGSLLI